MIDIVSITDFDEAKINGLLVYGKPIEECSREELYAVIFQLDEALRQCQNELSLILISHNK